MWARAHHSKTWGILAAPTWNRSSRRKLTASPTRLLPFMMRSGGFAEFQAQLEQESRGCLAFTVLQYRHSAGWQRLASLRTEGFWITAPSEFQASCCPLSTSISQLLLSSNSRGTSI